MSRFWQSICSCISLRVTCKNEVGLGGWSLPRWCTSKWELVGGRDGAAPLGPRRTERRPTGGREHQRAPRACRPCHRRHRRRCHRHPHQLPLPPPRSPASFSPGGKQAQPALLRSCALHPRPCELPAVLLPASGVAGDEVATCCACSRGTVGTPATSCIASRLCCFCMAGCGCGYGLGCWKPGWRPASRKIKSGLLPQFGDQLLVP